MMPETNPIQINGQSGVVEQTEIGSFGEQYIIGDCGCSFLSLIRTMPSVYPQDSRAAPSKVTPSFIKFTERSCKLARDIKYSHEITLHFK